MRETIAWPHIPTFVEVVRQGSFTKAAAVLGNPKSTVSRHVSALEASLGVALLVRTTRRLRLTEEGERFYRGVATAIEAVEDTARALAEEQEEPHGQLRITALRDYEALPAIMREYLQRHPDVSLDVNVTGEVRDLVGAGYDLGIRAGRLDDSSLIARKVRSVRFGVFASARYLRGRVEPTAVADVAAHESVLFRPVGGVCTWSLQGPNGVEEVQAKGRLSVDDLLVVKGAVMEGIGIGLLPESMIEPQDSGVVRLLPEYFVPAGALHVVYPASRHVPARVRAFRNLVLARQTTEQRSQE